MTAQPTAATPPQPSADRHTFGAPRGTVRAILALCVAGSAYWLIANPETRALYYDHLLPEDLIGALLIVLGYYFADRASHLKDGRQEEKSPVWLPRGTVRAILVSGFIFSAGWLVYWKAQEPGFYFFALPAAGVILNIGAFLVGRLGRMLLRSFKDGGRGRLSDVLGDIKGAIGVAAGLGTVVVYCFPAVDLPVDLHARFLELFPSLISFYFGTR